MSEGTKNFPSALAMGEVISLQFTPDMSPVKGTIVGVGFTESKVLYDVAVWVEETDGPYTPFPLLKVDSYFCAPLGKSNFDDGKAVAGVKRKHRKVKYANELAGIRSQLWEAAATRRLEK